MNTVMEEKIKQAFQEWKQTEVKELIVETDSRNKQLSNTLLDMISKNPGITGKALRAYIAKEMPTVPVTYVPAILKGFYDKNFVNRIEVAPDGEKGRTTFSYTAIPVAVRKNMPKRGHVPTGCWCNNFAHHYLYITRRLLYAVRRGQVYLHTT